MTGIYLAGSILAGMLLHDAKAGWLGAIGVAGVAVTICLVRNSRSSLFLSLACLLMFGLGYWRASVMVVNGEHRSIANQHQFSGQVLDVPQPTSSGRSANVRLDVPPGEVIQAQLPALTSVKQGDLIRFSGYASSLPQSGINNGESATVWVSSVEVTGNQARSWQRLRAALADRASSALTASVPLPAGALAAGVLIGDDSSLTSRERDQFRAAGLSHLTAVSGWNIALITGLLMTLHSHIPLSLTLRIGLGILGIWGYAYLTGAEPSAIRAAVMGTICLIAIWRGRPRDMLTILLWAISLMLAIQPQIRHSLGFQLSVFATLGLVLSIPLMAQCPSWLALVLVPAIAEISVAPILLHRLGQYSLVSPVANLVVDPLVVPLAISAAATVAVGGISSTAGQIAGSIPWLLGKAMMSVAAYAAAIPGASGRSPYLSRNAMVAFYGVLTAAYVGLNWVVLRSDQPEEVLFPLEVDADA